MENLQQDFDEVKVLVGSSNESRTEENPLNFEERRRLIENCLDVEVIGIEDEGKDEEGNTKWAEKVSQEVGDGVLVSGNDLVKKIVREKTDLKLREPDYQDPEVYSGTEIRRRIRSGEEWRYLVPKCASKVLEDFLEEIEESGIQYDFEPGWKRENAYHGTGEK
jgi:nicotinamide-nucleotide adenylyltransferase